MTVFIHYTGSSNFRVIITQLQPQLSEDDDIYIVDSSPNREGLRLSKLYGSTRCYIFVEVGDYPWDKAFGFAQQSMKENKQDGILCLSEDIVVSHTFISNVKRAAKLGFGTVYPSFLKLPYPQFPNSFTWYNPPVKKLEKAVFFFNHCFYQKADANGLTGVFREETVVLLPTKITGV